MILSVSKGFDTDNRRGAVHQVEGYAVFFEPDDGHKAKIPGRSRQKIKREESKGLSKSPGRSSGRAGSRGRERQVSKKDTPAFPFEISVSQDLVEERGFKEKEKSLKALGIFVVEKPSASTRMHIARMPDESNRLAIIRGIPIYGPEVLRHLTKSAGEALRFVTDLGSPEVKRCVYKPLQGLKFHIHGTTIGSPLEQQLIGLIE